MRLLATLLIVVAGVVYSVAEWPPAAAAGPGRTFRVATYNIYKGAGFDGHYNLQRTIETIAGLDADLVGAQEVMRNDPNLNCDDQPTLIVEGLRRLTGRRWSTVYAKSWTTADRRCLERGRGDDVAMEVVALFTRERILASEQINLAESRVGLMARVAAMPDVPVVVTHLAASRRNQGQRVEQIGALLPWAGRHGAGILMGDFNARPESPELAPLFSRYKDAWVDAWERGITSGVPAGGTRPFGTSRIDYVLYATNAPLAIDSAGVVDTEASDHRPVVATFRRR